MVSLFFRVFHCNRTRVHERKQVGVAKSFGSSRFCSDRNPDGIRREIQNAHIVSATAQRVVVTFVEASRPSPAHQAYVIGR